MTRRAGNDTAPQVRALLDVLEAKQDEIREKTVQRDSARDEYRSLERDLARLHSQVQALMEIVADLAPGQTGTIRTLRQATASAAGVTTDKSPLAGMPRVHALETILGEAGNNPLHRNEILAEMRQRGFPGESLADTSAGLAYLKRVGRVVNPTRGFWQLRADSKTA